jgi:hypothetical protein
MRQQRENPQHKVASIKVDICIFHTGLRRERENLENCILCKEYVSSYHNFFDYITKERRSQKLTVMVKKEQINVGFQGRQTTF